MLLGSRLTDATTRDMGRIFDGIDRTDAGWNYHLINAVSLVHGTCSEPARKDQCDLLKGRAEQMRALSATVR